MPSKSYPVRATFTAYSQDGHHKVDALLMVTHWTSPATLYDEAEDEVTSVELEDFDIVGLIVSKEQALSIEEHTVEAVHRLFNPHKTSYRLDDCWLYELTEEVIENFILDYEVAA
jgi:hypothetical protein